MTKNKVKETFYELTKFYGQAKKIGTRITRDCLIQVFTVRCPNKIYRDLESFIIVYTNKTYKLEYRIKRNVSDNTCYVTQTNYIGSDVLDTDKYVVRFPIDTKLFKTIVKNDTKKFYERI